ncbi:MAG: acyl carrier protein [Anaerolineales bacterium]|nr:acyl carrier protein [Anaerolineales bacterium]
METIEQQIRTFIADSILFSNNGYPLPDDASFLESGVVDSMNVMEIVTFAEKAFGIAVQDHEIVPANFDSVANLSRYIQRKKTGVA